jgi:membrane protein required for colicin V production
MTLSSLHWIDYAILSVIALSVLTGLMRGFVRELIALCVWVAAIWVGYAYAPEVKPWLASYFHDDALQTAASFVLLLLVTLFVGSLVSSALSFMVNHSPLKGTDRLLGMGFGFARGIFIVALILGVVNLTSLAKKTEFTHSELYPHFKPLSEWIFSFLPEKPTTTASSETEDTEAPKNDVQYDHQPL